MTIRISLQNFDGPLDLLLHLIKTSEMDIYDIKMVEITTQYLAIIEQLKQLNLDAAGEFLLMAATLIHIKSRMLLPVAEDLDGEDEEADPRAELVRRLLEYQRYKSAADSLAQLPRLHRDVFLRKFVAASPEGERGSDALSIGVYQLAAAFHHLLQQAQTPYVHEVVREQLVVADFIHRILKRLSRCGQQSFADFFDKEATRPELVVTFLAMLELVKRRMIKISQSSDFQPIWFNLAVSEDELDRAAWGDEDFDYE